MVKKTSIIYEDKEYQVIIEHKSLKPGITRCRFRNDTFYVSASHFVRDSTIMGFINDKWAKYFISRKKPDPIGNDFIYILGYRFIFKDSGEIAFTNGEGFKYKSKDDFNKKIRKFFLSTVTKRVRLYEQKMNLSYHNVKVRDMTTRYGTNSKKTNTVYFALSLYHYSIDIIDAIVVHELAHSLFYDHSKNFYNIVYKYCPNYKILHKQLKKGNYSND